MKRILPFIIILAVLGVALGSAWYMTRSASPPAVPATPTASAQTNNQPAQLPPAVAGVPGADPPYTLGSPNAPARLEEFGDYQCPPCGMFHPILQQMHKEFGDKLQITFREFPLTPTHQHALEAASAAEAAGLQGKFWQLHDVLYEHQKDWSDKFDVRPIFEGYAKDLGLDMERYKRDVESEQVAQRIFLDGKRGHSMGVKGTPTVFLNDREVPFASLPADSLRVLIQQQINNAGNR